MPARAAALASETDRRPPWLREIIGGGIVAIATVSVVLTLGLLSYSPLGEGGATAGITAAFVSVTVGGLLFALLGSSAMPVGGPSSATTIIFAALLATLIADPQVSLSNASDRVAVISTASLAVVLMGAIQVALAGLGIGRLAKFVPQPVLAGFMNGVAVLILMSQLPALLGFSGPAGRAATLAYSDTQPLALAVGLTTAAATWLTGWRLPRAPAPLVGLSVGLLLYALLSVTHPDLQIGAVVGPLPTTVPSPDLTWRLLAPGTATFALRHADAVFTSALILALISSLESVLGALAIDQQLNSRHDAARELMGLGVANLVSGLFGGLPMVLLRARALATLRAGGRGLPAALAGAVTYAITYACFGPALSLLPKAVLAGIMITIAFALADRWTHQLLVQVRNGEQSVEAWRSLVIVAIVCGVTVWQGFIYGVGVGVLASLLVFIHSMNRSLIRSRFSATVCPSRRLYPPEQERQLKDLRHRVVILELEGALFFGSADRLADEIEQLNSECRFLIVDLKRVNTIDESGAVLLQQISNRLKSHQIALFLAGVLPDNHHGRRLRAFGCFREKRRADWFPDTDRAIEAAEQLLLSEPAEREAVEVPLEACSLFRGVEASDVAFVQQLMERKELRPGEVLFHENDPADHFFILTRGSLTIVSGAGPADTRQRYASFSPGVMLGETAMLDGGGRSASATADSDVEVFVLSQDGLEQIAQRRPQLAAQLFRNIAIHLAQRLRSATLRR